MRKFFDRWVEDFYEDHKDEPGMTRDYARFVVNMALLFLAIVCFAVFLGGVYLGRMA